MVEYGSGKHLQYLLIHDVHKKVLLAFFHAFTEADSVSGFTGVGKCSSLKIWMAFQIVIKVFRPNTNLPINSLKMSSTSYTSNASSFLHTIH